MTDETMPSERGNLFGRCWCFVEDQAEGEWGDNLIMADATKMMAFVQQEITAALAEQPVPAVGWREALQAQEDAEDARDACECEGEGPWEHCGPCSERFIRAIVLRRAVLTNTRRESLARMVVLDEEMEAKHPGWMTGEPRPAAPAPSADREVPEIIGIDQLEGEGVGGPHEDRLLAQRRLHPEPDA